MTVLHLGIIDVPYSSGSYDKAPKKIAKVRYGTAKRGDVKAERAGSATKTTGDVAEILESKYHIMEFFFEDVGSELIGDALANSVAGAIENLFAGAPAATINPSAEAMSEIEAAFKLFLSQQEMDGQQPGVPTKAAQMGVNHRFLHPYAKSNPSRPSFIDTGLYSANFKSWID